MFLGHYGLTLAAKRVVPRTSLGALTFAAEFLDELWPVLLLLGVEQVRIVPGLMAMRPLDFVHYPYSHSLLMAIGPIFPCGQARVAQCLDGVGRWGFRASAVALPVLFVLSNGSPPPSERALAWSALAIWLFVPWSSWVDKHRMSITPVDLTPIRPSTF